jgi:D-sedoheptulose 7-phosphate isomerase
MTSPLDFAHHQIDESARIHGLLRPLAPLLADLAGEMAERFKAGGRAYFFGNGGSAADAQHWAAELSGRFYFDRPALPAFALTTNTSQLSAIANDYGYDETFARPVRGMVTAGDVVLGISTSGRSPNVVRGLAAAREKGALTVGFTGEKEGDMAAVCDVLVQVPSSDTPRVQEGHALCGHVLCALVERLVFGRDGG